MKVSELIEQLNKLPQDADVWVINEGFSSICPSIAYASQDGCVQLATEDSIVFDEGDRPVGAPTGMRDPYWHITKAWMELKK